MLIKVPKGEQPREGIIYKRGFHYNIWRTALKTKYPIVKKNTLESDTISDLSYLVLKPDDPHEAIAYFETIQPDTIAFILVPKCAYVGNVSVKENINVDYCKENNIPIVKSIIGGRGYFYRENDAIWLLVSTSKTISFEELSGILQMVFKKLSVDINIISNDIRVGDRRIGMFKTRKDYDHNICAVEFIFDTDFDLVKKAMLFPFDKWRDKPVDKIEDWVLPINEIGISNEELIEAVISVFEQVFKVKSKKRYLRKDEKNIELLSLYKSDKWLFKNG